MKGKLKNKKGITLIALVITVVVMLILAGVAISVLVDGDGLFNKTRAAAEEYKNAAEEEAEQVKSLIEMINGHLKYPLGTTVFTENKTYDELTTGTYNNPIIPKGFYPVNENGATWGTEDGYKYGLIISDSAQNQYVWVPVDGTNIKFGRQAWYGEDGITEFQDSNGSFANLSEELPTELTPNGNGVIPNGGFYIARFEAGIAEGMLEPIADTTNIYGDGTYKPVSRKGVTPWRFIKARTSDNELPPGNGAITVARSMYPENSSDYGVVSTLIYGAQWDTALKFIQTYDVGEERYATYPTNSYGLGNYISGDSLPRTGNPANCGALSEFRQKNIYDMAGNVAEITMEKNNYTQYIIRGSNFSVTDGKERPAAWRFGTSWGQSNNTLGFRIALYLK